MALSPPAAQVPFTRAVLPRGSLLLAAWVGLPAEEGKMEGLVHTWAPRGSYHLNTVAARSFARSFMSPFPLGDTFVCGYKAPDFPL